MVVLWASLQELEVVESEDRDEVRLCLWWEWGGKASVWWWGVWLLFRGMLG